VKNTIPRKRAFRKGKSFFVDITGGYVYNISVINNNIVKSESLSRREKEPISAGPVKGDEDGSLSKDSADAATALRRVEKGTTKSGIKTVTERSRIPYRQRIFAHRLNRGIRQYSKENQK
jgi:hypothetical protein